MIIPKAQVIFWCKAYKLPVSISATLVRFYSDSVSHVDTHAEAKKVLYKDKTYYTKPRPGRTHFSEEFTLDDLERWQKEGFLDLWNRPQYRKLKYFFVNDKYYEENHRRSWQYAAQLREHEGLDSWILGKYDLILWNVLKTMLAVGGALIVYMTFNLVMPKTNNPYVWNGDENAYMGLKHWLSGNKIDLRKED